MSEGISAAEYLEMVARFIVEMESENDCVGATAGHLQEMGKNSHLEHDEAVHVHTLWQALSRAGAEKEVEQDFNDIINREYTPEEVEELTSGGDEQ